MKNEDSVWDIVDSKQSVYAALSDQVWATPELGFGEFKSVKAHEQTLVEEGFNVELGIAGLPTAIVGKAGKGGGPVIAFLGEFDALPELSQEAGGKTHSPIEKGGNGHGCGHNILGSASMLAAAAVKDWLEANNVAGEVRYYGCPAEENGGGKGFMARAGTFDDVDIAITWHPAGVTKVDTSSSLTSILVEFSFNGRAAHAAASPHLGRSALDAVELMNVGVNYMREHMPSHARIHYAIVDSGGTAPNVVQPKAMVRYMVRGKDNAEAADLLTRVVKIAEGASLMTETSMSHQVRSAASNLIGNAPLHRLMHDQMNRLGAVPFDRDDESYARDIHATLSRDDIRAEFGRIGMQPDMNKVLCDFVVPLDAKGELMMGSTDVGDVSWVVPTVQGLVATLALGTPFHTWQVTAQGKAGAAHKGLAYAAKVMAGTAIELLADPGKIDAAKAAHGAATGSGYVCPFPPETAPDIVAWPQP